MEAYGGNILRYWKDRKTSLSSLYSLARSIIVIPATITDDVPGTMYPKASAESNPHGDDSKMEHRQDYGYAKDFCTALPQIIAVSVKNLLLLSYGMTLGFPTLIIPAVSQVTEGESLLLSSTQISWIGSINLIAVPLGCLVSGAVSAPIGRRRSMQLVNFPFIAAWIIFGMSDSVEMLYAALIITGISGGLLEAPVLTYVAEITQPYLRGTLSATSSMCTIVGVFTQFLLGLFFYWRTVAFINIIFSVTALVALMFVPESPYWLVQKNRFDDAKKSLQWLRGWTTVDKIEKEYKDLYLLIKKQQYESGKGATEISIFSNNRFKFILSLYTKKTFLKPYLLVSLTFLVGHFSGMTTLQTYSVIIFQKLEAPINKYYATLVLGIIQIIGALVCVGLVHFTGKRILTTTSTTGVGMCCIVIAVYGYLDEAKASSNWIPTTILFLSAMLSHIGIRMLPWILIGEVFSTETKSAASGMSSGIGYIFGFLANKFFLSFVSSLTLSGTYLLFAVISFLGTLTFYYILPETEGKTLAEIEDHYAGRKRLSNQVGKYDMNDQEIHPCNGEGKSGMDNPTFEMGITKL